MPTGAGGTCQAPLRARALGSGHDHQDNCAHCGRERHRCQIARSPAGWMRSRRDVSGILPTICPNAIRVMLSAKIARNWCLLARERMHSIAEDHP